MRHLSTFALAGLFGGLLLVGDASACHKKKCPCPAPVPVCAPVVVCAPVPVCAPAPVCAPKKTCHFKMPKFSLCHKKAAPVCAPVYTSYSVPVMATPQGSMQKM